MAHGTHDFADDARNDHILVWAHRLYFNTGYRISSHHFWLREPAEVAAVHGHSAPRNCASGSARYPTLEVVPRATCMVEASIGRTGDVGTGS